MAAVALGKVERGPRNGAEAVLDKAAADDTKSQESAKGGATDKEDGADEKPAPKKDAETEPPAAAGAQPKSAAEAPPGAVGVSGQIDGVALRYVSDNSGKRWTRLDSRKGLQADDRIVTLAPYRAPIKVGQVSVDLIGNVEVRMLGPAGDDVARLDLIQGRVLVHGANPPQALPVRFAGESLKVIPPANGVVALQRIGHRGTTDQRPLPAIRIYVPDGEAKLIGENETKTVTGPASVLWQPPSKLVERSPDPAPPWIGETTPSPVDLEIGRHFAQYFVGDRAIDTSLNEALEDEQGEVRRLAIAALGTVGALDMIVPALSTPGRPESRRAAVAVLRAYMARGSEASKQVYDELLKGGGDEWAKIVDELLVGYTVKQASEEATYARLVRFLKNPDLSVRELAIENLQALTDRDSMQYDPDQPEGPGLQAWQDLLKRKELPPKPAKPATATKEN